MIGALFGCVCVYAGTGFRYAGVKRCQFCHLSKSGGAIFQKWRDGAHARAYRTLGTGPALQIAHERGIAADPQKAPECLVCHTTGYGEPIERFLSSFSVEEGVGCESCHKPGEGYAELPVMKDWKKAQKQGLAVKPDESVCKRCHNEKSPAYRPFRFNVEMKKIRHLIPGAKRSSARKARENQ